MSWIVVIAGVGVAIAGAGTGYAMSGAGAPTQPNLAASSKEMANVEAELLPVVRQMQAAAEEGGTALLPGYKQETRSQHDKEALQTKIDSLQKQIKVSEGNPNRPGAASASQLKSQLSKLQAQYNSIPDGGGTVYVDKKGNLVPASQAVANFKGSGEADIQGKIMQQEAQNQLDLSKEFDSQYIQSALEQEKLADPQSFEARQKLYELIQQQVGTTPDSPVADEMQRQVKEKVAAGSGLTPEEQQLLARAVASGSADRGGTSADANFSDALTSGLAGEQRALANANAGAAYLASGQTPEDIKYRAEQQDLADLAAYINGQTPQSQFRELSGAQAGPTPVSTGTVPALSTMGNAGQLGQSAAVQGYGLGVQNALQQANPWMAGLSSILGAANVAGAAGYKPLALQSQTQGLT